MMINHNNNNALARYDNSRVGTAAGGYPDFINGGDGGVFAIVSQKGTVPRSSTVYVHRIDDALLAHLYAQHNATGPPSPDRLAAVRRRRLVRVFRRSIDLVISPVGWLID